MLLSRIPGDSRSDRRFQELKGRVRAAETKGKVDDPPNGGCHGRWQFGSQGGAAIGWVIVWRLGGGIDDGDLAITNCYGGWRPMDGVW
jgi:hypothetical protein